MTQTTYLAKFMRGDKFMYDAVMFAGFNGVLTAIKPGAFSISMNARLPS